MDNLIPLFLDKNSGNWVAKEVDAAGIPNPFFDIMGFVFVATDSSKVWNIEHNGNSTNIFTQIYTNVGENILPDSINIIDQNNIRINFNTAQNGKAILLIFRENT